MGTGPRIQARYIAAPILGKWVLDHVRLSTWQKANQSAQGRGGSRRLSHKFDRESGGSATKTDCLYVIVTTTTQELETIRSSTRARDIFCLGIFTEQLGPPKSPLPRCPPACANTEFEFSDSVQSGDGDSPEQNCVCFSPARRWLRNRPRRRAQVTRMASLLLHVEVLSPPGAVHGDCFCIAHGQTGR